MNTTLKKYELMKELGILDSNTISSFVATTTEYTYQFPVAAILERACREWLEKKEIDVNHNFGKTYTIWGCDIDRVYDSFDAAQIAALEYCLKERTTQCTED